LTGVLNTICNSRLFSIYLLSFIVGAQLSAAAPAERERILSQTGPIVYINESNGRDAIFIRDAVGESKIFTCMNENEIILTPSVSGDGKHITFLVDNARNQKTIHILGPFKKVNQEWQAEDLELISVRGGAWPVIRDGQSVYMSMPDQTSLVVDRKSNIYLIHAEEITQVSDNRGVSSHIWPLIHPDGQRIIYRYIPQTDELGDVDEPTKSILLDLESGASESHFVDQFVFLEQWTKSGEILFSFRDKDENGNRIYSLYNPTTHESREIYRNKSRQGYLSKDSRFLTTIRLFPQGSAHFDIFITDLKTKVEINLTETPKRSESLIGWLQ